MIGTIANTAAILAGSLIGGTVRHGLKEKYQGILYVAMGLAATGLGINAVVQNMPDSSFPVLFIGSLAIGGVVGTAVDLEGRFNKLVESRAKDGSQLARGLSTAIMLFCIGTLSILGPINSALHGDETFLFTNAMLDFVTSMVLASTFGYGIAVAAAVLPVLFIYIMIAKPDYRIMNGLAHVVLPVANWVGDVITWPVRAVGAAIENVRELSNLRSENEELRVRLDDALRNKNACDIAIAENQKLARELDIVQSQPRGAVVADVTYDNTAFHHSTFLINRGVRHGMAVGMVVTSTDGMLVGIITDVAPGFSRVRALTDSNTNIAVRIAGSEVYGFLQGIGSSTPTMGFFSDPEFQPSAGVKLVTSNISGVLPNGITVGEMINDTDVRVLQPETLSRVIVLQFDTQNEYK